HVDARTFPTRRSSDLSAKEPVRLYFNDFDNNDKKEQILTYYVQGKEIPFASKDELQKQMPLLKNKYLYAADFAKATLTDIFSFEDRKSTRLNSSHVKI